MPGIKVTVDRLSETVRTLQDLAKMRTMVGIPAADPLGLNPGSNQRKGSPGIDNATLGYIHEFGAPGANIPARPFLVLGMQNALPRVTPYIRAAGEAALDGGSTSKVEKNFHATGLLAQAAVRAKITDGPFAPLKPATIAARRRRHAGRRATTSADVRPLIDTGQLRASISYVVRKV